MREMRDFQFDVHITYVSSRITWKEYSLPIKASREENLPLPSSDHRFLRLLLLCRRERERERAPWEKSVVLPRPPSPPHPPRVAEVQQALGTREVAGASGQNPRTGARNAGEREPAVATSFCPGTASLSRPRMRATAHYYACTPAPFAFCARTLSRIRACVCAANAFAKRARLHWRRGRPIGLSGDEFTPPGRRESFFEKRGEQFALRISSRWFLLLFFIFIFLSFLSLFSLLFSARLLFSTSRCCSVWLREAQLLSRRRSKPGLESSEGSVNWGVEKARMIAAIFVSRMHCLIL